MQLVSVCFKNNSNKISAFLTKGIRLVTRPLSSSFIAHKQVNYVSPLSCECVFVPHTLSGFKVGFTQSSTFRSNSKCYSFRRLIDTTFYNRFEAQMDTLEMSTVINFTILAADSNTNPHMQCGVQYECVINGVDLKRYEPVLNCTQKDKTIYLSLKSDIILPKPCDIDCRVALPVRFDLVKVSVSGRSNINLRTLEIREASLTVENGNCGIIDIKAYMCRLLTGGGDIVSGGTVQAKNLVAKTRSKGNVLLKKSVCRNIDISTRKGDVDIESLYSDKTNIITDSGNIHIGSTHGKIYCQLSEGDIMIDTLDGELSIYVLVRGNAYVHITRHTMVQIILMEGNISLKLPKNLLTSFNFLGRVINIDSAFAVANLVETKLGQNSCARGMLGDASSTKLDRNHPDFGRHELKTLTAMTFNGNITVESQDWISSLGLGKFSDDS